MKTGFTCAVACLAAAGCTSAADSTDSPHDSPFADVKITKTSTDLTIVALDSGGVEIGKFDVFAGKFIAGGFWTDGTEGVEWDGIRFSGDVLGEKTHFEGDKRTTYRFPAPSEGIASFVHDPRIEPTLAEWGLHWKPAVSLATALATPSGERGYTIGSSIVGTLSGTAGYFEGAGTNNDTYGGMRGWDRQVGSEYLVAGPACGAAGSGTCNLCNHLTWADMKADSGDSGLGENGSSTMIAQLCQFKNLDGTTGKGVGATCTVGNQLTDCASGMCDGTGHCYGAFAIKSCPGAGNVSDCTGTTVPTGQSCLNCPAQAWVWPYGSITNYHDFYNTIGVFSYSTSPLTSGARCNAGAQCSSGSCSASWPNSGICS